MIKGKFGDSVRSKGDTAQVNEVLAKVLCHKISFDHESLDAFPQRCGHDGQGRLLDFHARLHRYQTQVAVQRNLLQPTSRDVIERTLPLQADEPGRFTMTSPFRRCYAIDLEYLTQ